MKTLGEDFPVQQARCREILGRAKELPRASGWFLVASLEDLLQRADKALIGSDIVQQVCIYQEMRDVKE